MDQRREPEAENKVKHLVSYLFSLRDSISEDKVLVPFLQPPGNQGLPGTKRGKCDCLKDQISLHGCLKYQELIYLQGGGGGDSEHWIPTYYPSVPPKQKKACTVPAQVTQLHRQQFQPDAAPQKVASQKDDTSEHPLQLDCAITSDFRRSRESLVHTHPYDCSSCHPPTQPTNKHTRTLKKISTTLNRHGAAAPPCRRRKEKVNRAFYQQA
ncbi:hypothetical protein OPV22_023013 [Ensete ventricosum]|uniref:Uncharacterized protein n=1 Tax=Ensete ventricosum TaxID=4639 RepID=A0AAV8PCB0_ENSVE|nr:hypothetical protein OPV22_023013 [Ensete ventricosum]